MLEVKNLVVGYTEDVPVLTNVSIHAPIDKVTCIIGPNGAGKSTLLKAIFGFLKPKTGTITLNGENLVGKKPNEILRAGISLIPQSFGIFPLMSVEQNLLVGAWTLRRDRDKVGQEIEKIWERYPLLKKKKKDKASSLSGGEQRLLDIAKSLIVNPKLILADEPTAGLSVKFYGQVYSELESLRRDDHRGIVLVDQNVRGAIGISDHVYVLESGQNSLDGSRADFEEGKLKEIARSWLGFE